MKNQDKTISNIRRSLSEVQNDVVDNVIKHRLDRRSLLLHGSRLGVSLSALGVLSGAMGLGSAAPARAAGRMGGALRVALSVPPGAIDPVLNNSEASEMLVYMTGEYLCIVDPNFVLRPNLATSWTSNADGTVWTFKLRPHVKFTDGSPMNADAVIATVERLLNPQNNSNALSAFKGVLSQGASHKIDDLTVAFHLDAPNGNFPYTMSSDNYNLTILPANYAGNYEQSFIGTGPFKLESYTPKVGAAFVRNEDYWGRKAYLDRVEFTFYADDQAKVLALQGGDIDLLPHLANGLGRSIFNNPKFRVIPAKSSATTQLHMRCDLAPFNDKRVRQALALTIDRPALADGLFQGKALLGNESPFASVYPSADLSVPQRKQDLAQARALLEQARLGNGFDIKLTAEQFLEIPDYAVAVQSFAKQAGINIALNIESQDAYYGKALFGQSDWLDSPLGMTDYSTRGVPNVLLEAPLTSNGPWNAAHFKNPEYDGLVAQYISTMDLTGQRAISGKIERLLLDETPVIFSYFYDYLFATTAEVTGLPACAARLYLGGVSLGVA
jgi:peptide/nickel transport system substrate-binding protein